MRQVAPLGTTTSPESPDVAGQSLTAVRQESSGAVWLPPQQYQLPPTELLPTPTDERGLILIPELLESVKSTVDPEYQWPLSRRNESTHHFYWPEAAYPYYPDRFSPGTFRNLSIHKAELPRAFENWLHIVTESPPLPSEEVMQYRVEAWQVATNLFKSVRRVIQWEKRARRRASYISENPQVLGDQPEVDEFGEQYMAEIIDRHFVGVERHMSALEHIPPGFRLIEPADSPQELANRLGPLVVPRSLRLAHIVRQTAPEDLAA